MKNELKARIERSERFTRDMKDKDMEDMVYKYIVCLMMMPSLIMSFIVFENYSPFNGIPYGNYMKITFEIGLMFLILVSAVLFFGTIADLVKDKNPLNR